MSMRLANFQHVDVLLAVRVISSLYPSFFSTVSVTPLTPRQIAHRARRLRERTTSPSSCSNMRSLHSEHVIVQRATATSNLDAAPSFVNVDVNLAVTGLAARLAFTPQQIAQQCRRLRERTVSSASAPLTPHQIAQRARRRCERSSITPSFGSALAPTSDNVHSLQPFTVPSFLDDIAASPVQELSDKFLLRRQPPLCLLCSLTCACDFLLTRGYAVSLLFCALLLALLCRAVL